VPLTQTIVLETWIGTTVPEIPFIYARYGLGGEFENTAGILIVRISLHSPAIVVKLIGPDAYVEKRRASVPFEDILGICDSGGKL